MPNATPPARYDSPWKAAVMRAFRDFMTFFFPEFHALIDWSKRPRFCDKELMGFGLGDAPHGLVADNLVEVYLLDGSVRRVLIHIEVQAQRDAALAERLLDYNYRIWKAYKQPVASFVVLADDDPNWHPRAFHMGLGRTMLDFTFDSVKLLDNAENSDVLEASDNPFALIKLAHLRTQQAGQNVDQRYAVKVQLIRLLFQHGWNKARIMMMFDVINWMMTLPEPHQSRFWDAVVQIEEERKMKWISPLEQSFIDKGLKQGLEQGRKEGAVALLARQLTRRFGPLSKTARNKLAKASIEQLEGWSDALSEAESINQVLG